MTERENYFLEYLYPFQDAVLNLVNGKKDPFYLTGGTALSRFYLKHRYSTDLDLFTNNSSSFTDDVNDMLKRLEDNFYISDIDTRTNLNYVRRILKPSKDSDLQLQIDFVNDIQAHFGEKKIDDVLGNVDSLENILTNKISALMSRTEAKDVVDLWAICKIYSFSFKEIILKTFEKEANLDLNFITEFFLSMPKYEFEKLEMIDKTSYEEIMNDLEIIAQDIINEGDNSIFNIKNK